MPQGTFDISDHIEYISVHVWQLFDSWKYANPTQRHRIAEGALLIFDELLSDNFSSASAPATNSWKQRLQFVFLNDSSFYANLLRIISVGPNAIESKMAVPPLSHFLFLFLFLFSSFSPFYKPYRFVVFLFSFFFFSIPPPFLFQLLLSFPFSLPFFGRYLSPS
jgi:hypothetical protein